MFMASLWKSSNGTFICGSVGVNGPGFGRGGLCWLVSQRCWSYITWPSRTSPVQEHQLQGLCFGRAWATQHTHTFLLASDVACRMGNGEQQKASCRCKSGSLEKEPVSVFASVRADLKITPASKTGSAERVTSACTGSNSSSTPPPRDVDVRLCNWHVAAQLFWSGGEWRFFFSSHHFNAHFCLLCSSDSRGGVKRTSSGQGRVQKESDFLLKSWILEGYDLIWFIKVKSGQRLMSKWWLLQPWQRFCVQKGCVKPYKNL